MALQTLIFNTKTKSVVVYEGEHHSKILYTFQDVPTVKVLDTYYEVMIKVSTEEGESRLPVGRFPISNTNMLIQN
jgi:hypothetical protein